MSLFTGSRSRSFNGIAHLYKMFSDSFYYRIEKIFERLHRVKVIDKKQTLQIIPVVAERGLLPICSLLRVLQIFHFAL